MKTCCPIEAFYVKILDCTSDILPAQKRLLIPKNTHFARYKISFPRATCEDKRVFKSLMGILARGEVDFETLLQLCKYKIIAY